MTTSYTARAVWDDPSHTSKVRVAHWLFAQVGQGSVFTKADMRDAIPGVEQIDRRMRELRSLGWVIKTYREMPSLHSNELYLDNVGARIWESV